MSSVKESITENIEFFRSRMNISQEELSSMCGYSSTYIGKIERGQRSPSLDTLIRIAEALQIPIASLFDPFYRRRSQLKGKEQSESFSPYDATIRRFNYIVGRLDPDGTVRDFIHLPWFQSNQPDDDFTDHVFWDLPFLQFSPAVSERLSAFIDKVSDGEPNYLPLKIPGYDFLDETVDLVLVPHLDDSTMVEEIRFELFFPRVVRNGKEISLDELQFDLANDA